MHPSSFTPIGAAYANDGNFGIGLHSNSHLDKPKLIHAVFVKDGIIPQECQAEFFVPELIEKGQTKRFEFNIRISKDITWQHLLAPYKESFQSIVGPVQYTKDDRTTSHFSSTDESWVRPDNPYGFYDIVGDPTSGWRRFDQDVNETRGVRGFVNVVGNSLNDVTGQGCILWYVQGFNPRGAIYRTDFDIFPPEVEKNLPTLIAGFAAKNLRIGLATRPGEGTERVSWLKDDTMRLAHQSLSQMNRLWSRFEKMIKLGFNIFYLDTFGLDYNDYQIMKMLRAKMGPDIPTFSEFGSDLMLPYSGKYIEMSGPDNALTWMTYELLEIQRWLVPNSTAICKIRAENMDDVKAKLDICGKNKLTPLIEDWVVSYLGTDFKGILYEIYSSKDI
jgi:hypothetical protein